MKILFEGGAAGGDDGWGRLGPTNSVGGTLLPGMKLLAVLMDSEVRPGLKLTAFGKDGASIALPLPWTPSAPGTALPACRNCASSPPTFDESSGNETRLPL